MVTSSKIGFQTDIATVCGMYTVHFIIVKVFLVVLNSRPCVTIELHLQYL